MNDIDPQAWLADVLARIAEHPVRRASGSKARRAATVEFADVQRAGQSGRLTMAGISYVFMISRVADARRE